MKVLITGAGGFIGAQLAANLVSGGHELRALDVSGGGIPRGVDWIQGDVNEPGICRSACSGVDVVVHCAAIHHIVRSLNDRLKRLALMSRAR